MAIIDTLSMSNFVDRIRKIRPENFTYDGLEALYAYLENLSEDTGQDIEFDPIGLCCEYAEYKNLAELQQNYEHIDSMEDLEAETLVIMINEESLIIQQF